MVAAPMTAIAQSALASLLAAAIALAPLEARPAAAAADPAKVLRIEFYVAETGFDPVKVQDYYSQTVCEAIFESLMTYDYLARPAKLAPRAAEAMPVVSDQARTYVFKILDSQSDRHIVQIFNADETVIYATILAIPNYRLRATDKTVITFRERPVGEPEALRAWFYPGRNWGEEFVYPKAKAIALAKAAKAPVLFTPVEMTPEVEEPIKSADAPIVLEMRRAPVMAIQPTGEEVQLAEVVTPPPAQTEVAAAPVARKRLPATASPLPLIGLLGLLALGGAWTLRVAQKRVL